jgi:hypothetical protein
MYVCTHRGVVAKSTHAYKEGEVSVFAILFVYVLNGRPLMPFASAQLSWHHESHFIHLTHASWSLETVLSSYMTLKPCKENRDKCPVRHLQQHFYSQKFPF